MVVKVDVSQLMATSQPRRPPLVTAKMGRALLVQQPHSANDSDIFSFTMPSTTDLRWRNGIFVICFLVTAEEAKDFCRLYDRTTLSVSRSISVHAGHL